MALFYLQSQQWLDESFSYRISLIYPPCLLPLIRTTVITLGHPDILITHNNHSLHLEILNLITSTKSLIQCKVAYLQIPGSLWDIILPITVYPLAPHAKYICHILIPPLSQSNQTQAQTFIYFFFYQIKPLTSPHLNHLSQVWVRLWV